MVPSSLISIVASQYTSSKVAGGTATFAAAPLGRGGVAVVQVGAGELPPSARGRSLCPSPEGEEQGAEVPVSHRLPEAGACVR
ncbi:MAG: hypothetical protein ACRC9V_03360, partial [Aeromonas sp.]